jgi:hypothetical protein
VCQGWHRTSEAKGLAPGDRGAEGEMAQPGKADELLPWHTRRCTTMNFDQEKSIITLYINSAQTYITLSAGVLALSMTFIDKVLGKPATIANTARIPPTCYQKALLFSSWLAFVLVIGIGALYQYLAIKYLDAMSDDPGEKGVMPQWLIDEPGRVYWLMVALFLMGVCSLSRAAWLSINP